LRSSAGFHGGAVRGFTAAPSTQQLRRRRVGFTGQRSHGGVLLTAPAAAQLGDEGSPGVVVQHLDAATSDLPLSPLLGFPVVVDRDWRKSPKGRRLRCLATGRRRWSAPFSFSFHSSSLLCRLALLESKGKPRRRRNRELRLGMEFKGAVG
jgi:hypothetical protein